MANVWFRPAISIDKNRSSKRKRNVAHKIYVSCSLVVIIDILTGRISLDEEMKEKHEEPPPQKKTKSITAIKIWKKKMKNQQVRCKNEFYIVRNQKERN